jgi:hypothetical protein
LRFKGIAFDNEVLKFILRRREQSELEAITAEFFWQAFEKVLTMIYTLERVRKGGKYKQRKMNHNRVFSEDQPDLGNSWGSCMSPRLAARLWQKRHRASELGSPPFEHGQKIKKV